MPDSKMIAEFFDAIRQHSAADVRRYLEQDQSLVGAVDPESDRSALRQALFEEQEEIVKSLIEFGADVKSDVRALGHALMPGVTGLAPLLIQHGANVHAGDYMGSFLHEAAMSGNLEGVKCLIEAGLSPNVINSRGETPLFAALKANEKECADYLSQFTASGIHEYLMASLAPHWKRWGVKMSEFRTGMTVSICSINEGGRGKGWRHATGKLTHSPGCAKAHIELRKIILASETLRDFKQKLVPWAAQWLQNGVEDLPIRLQ